MRMKRKVESVLSVVLFAVIMASCGKKTEFNNEIAITIPGVEKEYDYALFNDTHLFIGDDEIIPEYNGLVVSRINEFSLNGMTSAQNFDLWINNLDQRKLSGLILNADIVDQLSYTNLNHVEKVLRNVKIPYMYLQSDHDLATDWTFLNDDNLDKVHNIQSRMNFNDEVYSFEEEGFIIMGINYSWRNISIEALEEIKDIFSEEKPVIIITHVPYDSLVSDDLRELSKEKKNDRVLLWGTREDNYYYPNDYMMEYLSMISSDDSPVVAIIAAHLHETFETDYTEDIKEYITGTAYSGVKTLIRIVPE